MFCGKCGKENSEGAKYCEFCGEPIKSENREIKIPDNLKRRRQWYGIAAIILLCLLVGCIARSCLGNGEKKIIGEWHEVINGSIKNSSIVFYEDGTFTGGDEHGTYQFMNGKLVFRYKWVVSEFEFVYSYEFSGDRLFLRNEDGKEFEFVKR